MDESNVNPVVPTTSITQPNNFAPQIIVQQDNSTFPNSVVLDETNYPVWSQLIEMRIGARNKVRYLTGELTKPSPTDLTYDTWITENHKVRSWLIGSRLTTTKEIWEATSKTFYDGSDETRLFELNQQSFHHQVN